MDRIILEKEDGTRLEIPVTSCHINGVAQDLRILLLVMGYMESTVEELFGGNPVDWEVLDGEY